MIFQADSFARDSDRHLDSIITAARHGDTVALRLLSAARSGQDWTLHILAGFGVWVILSLLYCYGWPIVASWKVERDRRRPE